MGKAVTTKKKTSATTKKQKSMVKSGTGSARAVRSSSRTKTSNRATGSGREGAESLVVVESPAKAKTLSKYLGPDFRIEASVGHVKDLPERKLGVDIENNFQPQYVVLEGKEKVLQQIRSSAKKARHIYLAPDPDREGEAIAWHLADDLREHGVEGEIKRATFNEITKRAVLEGLANPRDLDANLFEAQQARRILDRIVGYKLSPLLGKKIFRGLSAGRVQSVAVRLVVEREREIENFIPQEYWVVRAQCRARESSDFAMTLSTVDGTKRKIESEEQVTEILRQLGAAKVERHVVEGDGTPRQPQQRVELESPLSDLWTVKSIERKEFRRRPAPPFITSTLQQEAARKLGFTAKQTMRVAQQLYERVELGELGPTGLITYMRTDSTRLSQEAVQAARSYIEKTFGTQYIPPQPNSFEKKKAAQDAHEAIRPTDLSLTPEKVGRYLDKQQLKLYELIWNRFIACQMADAILEQTRIESEPRQGYIFAVTGSVVKFPGFLAAYVESKDETDNGETEESQLPPLEVGDSFRVLSLRAQQKFTQPPPRYTEASFVKELERLGIGRPSTYATIVSTIQERKYVEKDEGKRFRPTEVGKLVTDLLVEHFPDIMDIEFTARMEEALDEVESGKKKWVDLLKKFYSKFEKQLKAAMARMREVKKEYEPTDILCDKCGQANMVIKLGRNGRFLACPRYPECKNTRNLDGDTNNNAPVETGQVCPTCGKPMVIRTGRYGRFLSCSGSPECKTTQPLSTGIKCPECGEGELTEAMAAKTRRTYWRCSNRNCKFRLFQKPVPEPCPQCGTPFLVEHTKGEQRWLACAKCGYKKADAPATGTGSVAPTSATGEMPGNETPSEADEK
jgi:DNA topoisomerase-1